MPSDTLLIEIGTEELPPASSKALSDSFTASITEQLTSAGVAMGEARSFVTPRRIAVSIKQAADAQAEQNVERKGPAIKAAYDKDGNPSKAALGFAKSCGVDIHDLETLETDKGAWLYFKSTQAGKSLSELVPTIIETALKQLPIPRPMRWGDYDVEFVRPIHWVVVMHGSKLIPCTIKNIIASNQTYGHRFHAPQAIALSHADNYESVLQEANVIADFNSRKTTIEQQLDQCAKKYKAKLDYSYSLLEEVTNLVEWPAIIVGEFSSDFLDIPQEALVVTMQDAQRYFPMFSESDNSLLPYFITIANIQSSCPDTIKHGNERVIKPRFEDAGFFWNRDKQKTLLSRQENLKGILFEKQLGTVFEKTQRIEALAIFLCDTLNIDNKHALRAAKLCKNDLLTDMVNEFPKLQGIMGRYYAEHDNESSEVANAIEEHYQPIQSGGKLPQSQAGKIIALCDRIDTLVGIFATGKKPTGVKDPYALRRAALGVIRICIEADIDFDLESLVKKSAKLLSDKLDTTSSVEDVFNYIMERLRGYCLDQGISVDIFESVRAVRPTELCDFSERVKAVQHFIKLEDADSLAAANKRIRNILKKSDALDLTTIDAKLFSEDAEITLYEQACKLEEQVTPKFANRDYTTALTDLAQLRSAIDKFFDDVMVMHDDPAIKNNRVALLNKVNALFITAADISLLQS